MEKLCEHLDITYDDRFQQYSDFQTVNGDVNYSGGTSRGILAKEIKLLPRKFATQNIVDQIHGLPDLKPTCEMLDYTPDYYDKTVKRETPNQDLQWQLVRFLKNPYHGLKQVARPAIRQTKKLLNRLS
jgi:hypothetical protein